VVDLDANSLELHRRVLKAIDEGEYESLRKFVQNKKAVKPMFRAIDENGATPLNVAVQRGDPNVVDALVSAMDGVDVNAPDRSGLTALHVAVSVVARLTRLLPAHLRCVAVSCRRDKERQGARGVAGDRGHRRVRAQSRQQHAAALLLRKVLDCQLRSAGRQDVRSRWHASRAATGLLLLSS
jgi:hypothetical protein